MKKNLIIIALIFIIPIVAYAILSSSGTVQAQKTVAGQPHVIKFSSKLCSDCKKLKDVLEELTPQYEKQIVILEYNVDSNDNNTTEAIDKYDISLVPTLIFIDKNEKETRRTEGFVNKETLKQYFDELIE